MIKNITIPVKELMKWIILGISLYLNYFAIFRIISLCVHILVVSLEPEVNAVIVAKIIMKFLELGIFVVLLVLVYINVRDGKIVKFPRGLSITSFILLPVLFLASYGVLTLANVWVAQLHGPGFFAGYYQVEAVASVIVNVLSVVALMIVGFVALNEKGSEGFL